MRVNPKSSRTSVLVRRKKPREGGHEKMEAEESATRQGVPVIGAPSEARRQVLPQSLRRELGSLRIS